MDITELLFNQPAAQPVSKELNGSSQSGEIDYQDFKRKKTARDFESIFIHQIVKGMKDTIPQSDMEDSSSEQIDSMYWSFLAEALADKGGFGLWEQIYQDIVRSERADTAQAQQNQHTGLDDKV